MVLTIRQHPHQFQNILEISKYIGNDDEKDEYLSKSKAGEQWIIASIDGAGVNKNTEIEINHILKQVDLNKGYHVVFKKKKKKGNGKNQNANLNNAETRYI
eukprot:734992_1